MIIKCTTAEFNQLMKEDKHITININAEFQRESEEASFEDALNEALRKCDK